MIWNPKERNIFVSVYMLFFSITGFSFKKPHEMEAEQKMSCICIWRYHTGMRASLYWDWMRCWLHKYHYLCWAFTISSTLLRTKASQQQCQGNCWRLPVILEKCHRTLHARWLLMKVMKVHAWKWSPIPYLVLLSFFLFWLPKRGQTQSYSTPALQNPH